MTTQEAAQTAHNERWNLSRYSTRFELIWQWIDCWRFGHIMESKVVLKTKGAVSTNYWCTRCGDAYGMTSGPLGAITYDHLAMIFDNPTAAKAVCERLRGIIIGDNDDS